MKEDRRKCFKCGSSPADDPDTVLYRFPKPGSTNSLRCEVWAKYCCPDKPWYNMEFQGKLHNEHRMLCHRHFLESAFVDFSMKKLRRFAYPEVVEESTDSIQEQEQEQVTATASTQTATNLPESNSDIFFNGSTTTDKTAMQDSNIDIETDKPDETERRIDLDNISSSNGCNITEPYPEFLETEFLDDIDTDVDEDPLALVPESESEEMEILYDLEPSIDPRMQDALNLHAQILKKGLKKDTKEALFKQYIIPEKFSLLHAPKLNPELSEAVTERIRAIDARVVVAQEQLGQGIAALYEGLELLINDSKENLAIKALSDSCQILCDLHHMQTQSRRNLIETNVDKELLNILQDLERDAFLFGNHLSETIKECKEKEETQKLVLVKSNLDTEILNFIQDENQEFSLENEVIADTNANKDNTIRGLRKIVFVDINVDNKGKDVKQDLRLEKEFETTKLGTQKVVNHNIDQKYSNVSQDLPFRYELLENSNTSKNIDEQNLEETENLDIQFPNVINAAKGLLGNNRARKIKASEDAVKQLHTLSPPKRPSTSAQQAVLQSINSTLSSNKQGGLKRTIVRKVKFLRPVKRATPTRVDSEQPTSDEDSPAWMYKT